ncbi:UNVERIFIED_CONTAM: hypothetical protein RMT77_010033 [Armadillidium vulgare]
MIIFGLGIGILLLILIWTLALIFLILGHNQTLLIKTIIFICCSILSSLLLIFPQEEYTDIEYPISSKILDVYFVPRVATLTILLLSAVGGLGIMMLHCSEPVLALPLQKPN